MAVFLSPVGGVAAQFFTNNGVPLSGGKLYTYAAGTTTPAATYTSSSGVTAHANPIVLDSGGRVPGGETWLTDGTSYKFLLKDSNDVLIATYDNIVGINSNFVNFFAEEEIQTATAGQTVFTLANPYVPGGNTLSVFVDGVNQYSGSTYSYVETSASTVTFDSGLHVGALVKFTTVQSLTSGQQTDAALVTYNEGGAGAVTTTVRAKLQQIVSVKDFGAVGNGTTDDTAAIQAAINSISDDGVVYVPPGTYKLTSALTLGSAGAAARLIGMGRPTFKFYSIGASVDCFTLAGASYRQIELRNLNIDFNTTGRDGLVLTISNWPVLDNIVLNNSYRDSFAISCSGFNWVENGEFDIGVNDAGRHAIRMELAGSNGAFINECLWKQLEVRGVSKITAGGQAIRCTSTATGGAPKFSNHMFLKSNLDATYSSGTGVPVPSLNVVEVDSGAVENWRFMSGGWENTGTTSLAGGYSWTTSGTGTWGGLFIDSMITNSYWGTLGANSTIALLWNFDYSFAKTQLSGPVTTKVAATESGYVVTGNTQSSGGSELKGTRTGAVGSGTVGNGANMVLGNDTNSTYISVQEFGGAYLFWTYASGAWNVRFKVAGDGAISLPTGLGNYANDAAAAGAGVAVGQLYRNGSVVQIRVT